MEKRQQKRRGYNSHIEKGTNHGRNGIYMMVDGENGQEINYELTIKGL